MSDESSQGRTEASGGAFTAIEVSPYGVLRAAGWPIETMDAFDEPALAALAREVEAAAAAVATGRAVVCDALAEVVPRQNQQLRRRLLEARRTLHRNNAPHPQVPALAARLTGAEPATARTLLIDDERRRQLHALSDRFAQLHERAQNAERRTLRRIGTDPRFLCALHLGSPQVASRWQALLSDGDRGRARPPRPNRVDRLENTVFGYVCRAAGRAVPSGAWAGVAAVLPGPGALDVQPAGRRTRVAPNLSAFEEVVVRLGAARSIGAGHPLRVDPKAVREMIPSADPFVGLVIEGFGNETRSGPRLIDALTRAVGDSAETRSKLTSALVSLVESEVVISAAVLPRGAADAWEALTAIGPLLDAPQRETWEEVVARMRAAASELERALDTSRAADVAAAVSALESIVAELRASAGLAPWSGSVVRVDTRLAFDVYWDDSARNRVEVAVRRVLTYYAVEGVAEAYRRASVRDLSALVATWSERARSPTLVELVGRSPFVVLRRSERAIDADAWPGVAARFPDPELTRVAARAAHRLAPYLRTDVSPVIRLPDAFSNAEPAASPGPAGSLRFELGGGELVFRAGRPEPGFATQGRMSWFPELQADLARWFYSWSDHGFEAVEVVGADPANPNAAVGRDLPLRRIGPVPGSLDPASLTVHVADDGRPFLRHQPRDGRGPDTEMLIPVHLHPAAVGRTNPLSAGLWRLAQSQGWEWLGLGLPLLPAEIEASRSAPLPRLELTEGAVLSSRRWVIDIAELTALAVIRGAEGYLGWRALADRLGLPRLVFIRIDSHPEEPERLIHTDSTLAVRTLLATVARRAAQPSPPRRAVVRELPDGVDQWPIRSARGHHLAELVVSWHDRQFWSQRSTSRNRPGVHDDVAAWTQVQWILMPAADGLGPDVPWSLVEDAVRALTEAGASHVWYTRKSGLRLRALGTRPVLGSLLARHSAAAVDAQAIRGWRVTTYEPEVDRFGGVAGMQLAHDLFHADTPTALQELQLRSGNVRLADRLSLCVAINVAMTRAALADSALAEHVWRQLETTAKSRLGSTDAVSAALVVDVGRVAADPHVRLASELRLLLDQGLDRAVAVGSELKRLTDDGQVADRRRDWLIGAVLFATNRRDFGLSPAELAAAFAAARDLAAR